MTEQTDTLNSTFSSFFGPSEDVIGGTVVRVVKGELTTVTVDAKAQQAAQAERQAEKDASNAAQAAQYEAEEWYDDQ